MRYQLTPLTLHPDSYYVLSNQTQAKELSISEFEKYHSDEMLVEIDGIIQLMTVYSFGLGLWYLAEIA